MEIIDDEIVNDEINYDGLANLFDNDNDDNDNNSDGNTEREDNDDDDESSAYEYASNSSNNDGTVLRHPWDDPHPPFNDSDGSMNNEMIVDNDDDVVMAIDNDDGQNGKYKYHTYKSHFHSKSNQSNF